MILEDTLNSQIDKNIILDDYGVNNIKSYSIMFHTRSDIHLYTEYANPRKVAS